MRSTSCVQQQFHGFVSLNNHGVTLLEQGKYSHAAEVFHDALGVVKQTLNCIEVQEANVDAARETIPSSTARINNEDETSVIVDVNSKVQKAVNWTLQSSSNSYTGRGIVRSSLPAGLNLHVLTHSVYGIRDTSSPEEGEGSLQSLRATANNDVFLIRTELADPTEFGSIPEISIDIGSSIILHNIGVANMLLAFGTASTEESSRLSPPSAGPSVDEIHKNFRRADHFLKLSQTLLEDLNDNGGYAHSLQNTDLEFYVGLIQTEMIVLETMILVQQLIGEDTHDTIDRLNEVEELRNDVERRISLVFRKQDLHAPAA